MNATAQSHVRADRTVDEVRGDVGLSSPSDSPAPSRAGLRAGVASMAARRQESATELTMLVTVVVVAYLSVQVLRPTSGVSALDVLGVVVAPLCAQILRRYVWISRYCLALGVWIGVIAVSAQLNGTGTGFLLRAATIPGLQLTAILVLVWLTHRLRTPVVAVVAVLGSQVYYVYFEREILFSNPWKFGLAVPVICLALVALARTRQWRIGSVVALTVFAGFSVMNDARGYAGMCLLTALLMVVIRPGWRDRSAAFFYGRVALALGVLLVVVAAAYAFAAGGGHLGYSAQQKFQEQTAGGNLLLVARPEVAFSIRAILHAPWIGSGGRPSLTVQDVTEGVAALANAGGVTTDSAVQRIISGGVNAHSLFFQSWVEAGVLSVIPWLLLIGLGVRAMRRAPASWQPLVVFWTIAVTWDVFFSPWVPHYHLLLAAYVVLMCRLVGDDAAPDDRPSGWFAFVRRLAQPASRQPRTSRAS